MNYSVEIIKGENKQEFIRNAEKCDQCGSNMDMWQTQYLSDGYDYIQWICQNESCGVREHRTLYHNDLTVKRELI